MKCEQYWPDDTTTRFYGDVAVTLVRTSSFANFDLRLFRVGLSDSDGSDHLVTQYHFTAWPDHGVPQHPLALLEFHAKVSAGKPMILIFFSVNQFQRNRLYFKICCMIPEPCYLRKCSPQCSVSTHCCHPKRL